MHFHGASPFVIMFPVSPFHHVDFFFFFLLLTHNIHGQRYIDASFFDEIGGKVAFL